MVTILTNTGEITVYNQLKSRLGGIIGYSNKCPTGSVCRVTQILYYRYNPLSKGGNGEVGGIAGYCNVPEFNDLTFIGGLQTTGSSPNCYTGGIIGRTNQSGTFRNCKVGKNGSNIVGASAGNFAPTTDKGAGLFSAVSSASYNFSFPDCIVASGTKCQSKVVTSDNMASAVIGRNIGTMSDLPALGTF